MELVYLLIKQNLIMFLYLMVGYVLYRKKLVGKAGSADLGRILLYVLMPAAILKSYCVEYSKERLEAFGVSAMAALLALLLSMVTARYCFKKTERIERFGVAFSNAGFIGIPLVQATLGQQAVFYVAAFVAFLNIFQWTYGVAVITERAGKFSLRKLWVNPVVLSFLAGIVLFLSPAKLPTILADTLGTLAVMNGPLAMLVLGTYLAQISLKAIFTEKIVYQSTVVRLFIIPLLTIFLFLLLPSKYNEIKMAIILAAAAPVGANLAIFAQLYNEDYTRAVKEICMSTLTCIVSLPMMVWVAQNLFRR